MLGYDKQDLHKIQQLQQQQKKIINQGEYQQFVNLPNDYFYYNTLIYYKPKQITLGNQPIQIAIPQTQNNNPVKIKPNQTDGKWLVYLKHSYEHYCKSTYRTGKNTTFDRIKSQSTLMNPSTFVAFCRDFGIKIQLVQLMNIFKKVTGFQSFMKFDQFFSAVVAISQILFAQQINIQNQNQFMQQIQSKNTIKNQIKSPQTKKQINQNSETFKKVLKYLNMHNSVSFHRKMQQIDKRSIKHGVNPYENLIKMKPLSQYKFKVTALNGKNPQQVKQQLSIRKHIKQKIKQNKIQKQIQAVKFAQINKLSPNQKKITPGGYMSPSLNNNKSKITHGNKVNDTKVTKNVSIINKSNLKINTYYEQSNQNSIIVKNKRFHTQLNSYQASLDISQYITDREKTGKQDDKKQVIKNKQQTNNKIFGYLQKFRQKAIKNLQKNKDKYRLNSVLKQAKQQSDTNNQYRQSIFASKQVFDHIKRAVNVSRNSDSIKMNNLAQNETKQIKNRQFRGDIRPISIYDKAAIKNLLVDLDQEDQYLRKLSNYNRSKKRIQSQL